MERNSLGDLVCLAILLVGLTVFCAGGGPAMVLRETGAGASIAGLGQVVRVQSGRAGDPAPAPVQSVPYPVAPARSDPLPCPPGMHAGVVGCVP